MLWGRRTETACRVRLRLPPASDGFGGDQKVPAEHPLEYAKPRGREPAEVPHFDISVLDIVGNPIREHVIHTNISGAESVCFNEAPSLCTTINVCDGASSLRL